VFLQKSAHATENNIISFRSGAKESTKSTEVHENARVIFCGSAKSVQVDEFAVVAVLALELQRAESPTAGAR
jgi:hypothetical protein